MDRSNGEIFPFDDGIDKNHGICYLKAIIMVRPFTFLVFSVLYLQGCSVLTMDRPVNDRDFELPGKWTGSGKGNEGKIVTGWIAGFEDARMRKLVGEALENNNNLKAVAARLASARQGTITGRAERFPSINLNASSSNSGRDIFSEAARYESGYALALAASWEMDLWGRLRDLDLAARADYQTVRADYRAARLSLAANVAKSWCNIITARQRLELAEQTRDSFVSNYRITERNYKAGDETATPLSVQFGRNNVASAERNLIARKLARDNAARPLEVLLGRYPSGELKSSSRLPGLPESVPAGLPSELLWRRPDIAAAAASLRASAKRADAARKNLLPSFSLTARGSDTSGELDRILANPETILWNAASSLAQSIFRGGALSAQAQRALAQNEQALHKFTGSVLEALREVESALAAERSLAEQERFISIELAQAKLAEAQAGRDYSEGLIGILSIFEAQRRGVAARNAMITLRSQRLQNRIDLHLALGGDFESLPAGEPGL